MKIKLLRDKGKPGYGEVVDVYGFYFLDSIIHFLVSPSKYFGITVYNIYEIEMVDPTVGGDIAVTNKYTQSYSLFLHREIINEDLYEKLIELDPVAYDEFMVLIGKPIRSLAGIDVIEEYILNVEERYKSCEKYKIFLDELLDIIALTPALHKYIDSIKADIETLKYMNLEDQIAVVRYHLTELLREYKK